MEGVGSKGYSEFKHFPRSFAPGSIKNPENQTLYLTMGPVSLSFQPSACSEHTGANKIAKCLTIITAFVQHHLCARHHAESFLYMKLFNSPQLLRGLYYSPLFLQEKKLRFRKGKRLVQGHTVRVGERRVQNHTNSKQQSDRKEIFDSEILRAFTVYPSHLGLFT